MTQKELLFRRFMMLYGDNVQTALMIFILILPIPIFLIYQLTAKSARKKKLKDNYIKVTVEMVDYIYGRVPGNYQLKMVYAHPKDNKKRYYFTEKIHHDTLWEDEVSLDYEYDMYVHPLDPKCYYVDVSNYVRNYPSFDQWIRRI